MSSLFINTLGTNEIQLLSDVVIREDQEFVFSNELYFPQTDFLTFYLKSSNNFMSKKALIQFIRWLFTQTPVQSLKFHQFLSCMEKSGPFSPFEYVNAIIEAIPDCVGIRKFEFFQHSNSIYMTYDVSFKTFFDILRALGYLHSIRNSCDSDVSLDIVLGGIIGKVDEKDILTPSFTSYSPCLVNSIKFEPHNFEGITLFELFVKGLAAINLQAKRVLFNSPIDFNRRTDNFTFKDEFSIDASLVSPLLFFFEYIEELEVVRLHQCSPVFIDTMYSIIAERAPKLRKFNASLTIDYSPELTSRGKSRLDMLSKNWSLVDFSLRNVTNLHTGYYKTVENLNKISERNKRTSAKFSSRGIYIDMLVMLSKRGFGHIEL